jgi:hypothetical protein
MDPEVLSRELGIGAEHSFRAGDVRQSRSRLAPAAVHAATYWLATLNPASWLPAMSFTARPDWMPAQIRMGQAVTQSLGWTLGLSATRFRSAHAALFHQIRSEGGQVSLLVAISAVAVSGFTLTPEVGRVFSELGVTLEFEFSNE